MEIPWRSYHGKNFIELLEYVRGVHIFVVAFQG